jgi:hypothetical protein
VLGDDNFSAPFVEIFDDPIRIEGFVGNQSAEIHAFDQRFNPHSVEAMSRQQLEPHQIAQGIGESEDPRLRGDKLSSPYRLSTCLSPGFESPFCALSVGANVYRERQALTPVDLDDCRIDHGIFHIGII